MEIYLRTTFYNTLKFIDSYTIKYIARYKDRRLRCAHRFFSIYVKKRL